MGNKIKVTLESIYVKEVREMKFGLSEWKILATIDGQEFGNQDAVFEARACSDIILDSRIWTTGEISGPRDPKSKIEIKIQITEEPSGVVIGSYTQNFTWPSFWSTPDFEFSHRCFIVELHVDLYGYDIPGPYEGNEVFACLSDSIAPSSNPHCFTISGDPVRTRFEICPVRPQPDAKFLPPRLRFGGHVIGKQLNKSNKGKLVTDTSPINVLPNPPVILLEPKGMPPEEAAIIECTYYQPPWLKIKESDLTWSSSTIPSPDPSKPPIGGEVDFVGRKQGTRIFVYGTKEGEVRFQLRFKDSIVANYRALIKPMITIRCRVTILDGGIGAEVFSNADHIYRHIQVANRYLRPAGVELKLDPSPQHDYGATQLRDGIFKMTIMKGETFNVPTTGLESAWVYNFVPKVLNIVYVNSILGADGYNAYNFKSTAKTSETYPEYCEITDEGSPSSSWIRPKNDSGVWPDKDASPVLIYLWSYTSRFDDDLIAAVGIPNLATAAQQSKDWAISKYGCCIAHEVGHAMNLCHRHKKEDGQHYPLGRNLMSLLPFKEAPPRICQNIDIVQAKAMHMCLVS